LAEVCGWLDKSDELQRYGCLSLSLSDRAVCEQASGIYPLNGLRPRFDANAKFKNIIAYSLFGNAPKYCEAAVINAAVAKALFPAWTCRFYIAEDVPRHVVKRLYELGAQTVILDTRTEKIHPLMWRFKVLDDADVDFYLIRDADSLLSEKEQAAVEQWLSSHYWFHHMRDYFTHTELLLAGMWGGASGMFPNITPLMESFCKEYTDKNRFIDQHFLRQILWPSVKQSLLSHDDIFKFHDAKPFPPSKPIRWQHGDFHIGSNSSYLTTLLNAKEAEGEMQYWKLNDQHQKEVCRYSTQVKNNRIALNLPFVYVTQLQAKCWTIELI
jgi:hypothetical protein